MFRIRALRTLGAFGVPRTARRAAVLGTAVAVTASALVSAAAGGASAAAPTVVHVSPTGGGRACSPGAPCDLAGAQAKVRTRTAHMTKDVEVRLAGGTYRVTDPLTFGPRDSGRNGHRVTWTAEPGAAPVISGGQSVQGWSPVDAAGTLYRASVGQVTSRQLYVDGERAVLARGAYNPAGFTKTATGYTTTTGLGSWRNPTDIDLVYRVNWTNSRCPVGAVSGTAITMAQPCWKNAHSSPYLQNDAPYFVENAYELLDEPGEWYLDRAEGNVYYRPKPGQRMTGPGAVAVTLPTAESLLRVEGSATERVQALDFRGLTFADSTWLRPGTAEGFAEEQANFTLVGPNASHYDYDGTTKTAAAVTIARATDVLFQANTVTRVGSAGINVERASNNVRLRGNRVFDVSGSGVQVGDILPADHRPANLADRMHDITVENNAIHHVAVEFQGGVGIFGGFTDTLRVLHNDLTDLPYTAISLGWGWGYLDKDGLSGYKTPTVARNNQVVGNLVSDFMTAGADGGGLYTLGAQPGSIDSGNVYANGPDTWPTGARYLDNGTAGWTSTGNVMENVEAWLLVNEGSASDPLHVPPAHDNTVTGNWTSTLKQLCCALPSNAVTAPTLVTGGAWPAAAQAVRDAAGLEPAWRGLRGNRVDLARGATATASAVYSGAPGYGAEKANDGSGVTRWATDAAVTTAQLTLTFPDATTVDRVVVREAKHYGARISTYRIEYWDGSTWVPTATRSYPSVVQTERFAPVTTTRIRLNITGSGSGPTVQGFEAYRDA
ncbi:right-handed parallel beta-helix repeat-containing protein [Embleya sp. NBC_00888]|uniref:discoidin domain-containing protein n=1 Tax=Embleya sp. NBC_00888 TaxID=2975960 RepID=UPI00386815DD|nr:right-handed parallel beta-helix repeat-containing protein [Embleya sp. NBC_00888]